MSEKYSYRLINRANNTEFSKIPKYLALIILKMIRSIKQYAFSLLDFIIKGLFVSLVILVLAALPYMLGGWNMVEVLWWMPASYAAWAIYDEFSCSNNFTGQLLLFDK